jgi:hypothetical protein
MRGAIIGLAWAAESIDRLCGCGHLFLADLFLERFPGHQNIAFGAIGKSF